MPWLPLATAPKSRPTAVAARIPTSAAAHGFHPASTESLAAISPATPKRAVCARETMPPWPDRNVRLTAAIPSHSEVSPTWLVTKVENSTGTRATTTSTRTSAPRVPRVQRRVMGCVRRGVAGWVGGGVIVPSRTVRSAAPRGWRRAGRR